MSIYAKTGIRLEIVWRTDNNKFRIDHKENAGTTHTDEREYDTVSVKVNGI